MRITYTKWSKPQGGLRMRTKMIRGSRKGWWDDNFDQYSTKGGRFVNPWGGKIKKYNIV